MYVFLLEQSYFNNLLFSISVIVSMFCVVSVFEGVYDIVVTHSNMD